MGSRVCFRGTCRRDEQGRVMMVKFDQHIADYLDREMLRDRSRGDYFWVCRPDESEELFKNHKLPEHVIVLGKGPSLDTWRPEGGEKRPIFGINEAALLWLCDYAFAMDPGVFKNWKEHGLPESTTIIASFTRLHAKLFPGQVAYFRSGEETKPGYESAPSLLQLLAANGVREVTMVGFDAYTTGRADGDIYAAGVRDIARPRSTDDYSIINGHIDEVATRSGLVLHWQHLQLP